jgi:hypothetical protein
LLSGSWSVVKPPELASLRSRLVAFVSFWLPHPPQHCVRKEAPHEYNQDPDYDEFPER